jgi:5,10-methylenetetrahydromethanopterin reductase
MDKTGFATGYDPALSVREMAELARQAEARGYDMAFFSETVLCNRDSVTAMAVFGLATTKIALAAPRSCGCEARWSWPRASPRSTS